MSRLFALLLVFIIGTPNCWCCLLKPAAKPKPHDCCMVKNAGTEECPLDKGAAPKHKSPNDCSCDLSKTKREMSPATVALPAPLFVIASPIEIEFVFHLGERCETAPWLTDDGPPRHEGTSVLAQSCILRL
jgi:hypothetical protein